MHGTFGGGKCVRLKKIYDVHTRFVDDVNITKIHILFEVDDA